MAKKTAKHSLLFFKVLTIKYSMTKTVKLLQSCNQLIAQQTLLLVKKMFVLALVWTQVLFHAAMMSHFQTRNFCPWIKPKPNPLLFFKVLTIKYSMTSTVKLLQSCDKLIAQQTLLLKKLFILALPWPKNSQTLSVVFQGPYN